MSVSREDLERLGELLEQLVEAAEADSNFWFEGEAHRFARAVHQLELLEYSSEDEEEGD